MAKRETLELVPGLLRDRGSTTPQERFCPDPVNLIARALSLKILLDRPVTATQPVYRAFRLRSRQPDNGSFMRYFK